MRLNFYYKIKSALNEIKKISIKLTRYYRLLKNIYRKIENKLIYFAIKLNRKINERIICDKISKNKTKNIVTGEYN